MKKEEAIKILKDFHDESAIFSVRTALETLYPEFRESEDERIRGAIIDHLKDNNLTEWAAWLEKQKDCVKLSDSAYTSNRNVIEFADTYSYTVWEKLMDKFKKNENYNIGCNDVSDIVLNAIINTYNWLEKQGNKDSEEKAKKYDEVVCKLRRFMEQGIDPLITRADVQDFFPELCESEDEKIRKALIEYFNEQCDMSDWNGVYGYQVVAWLEKQDESYTKRDVVDAYVEGIAFAKNELEKQGEQKPIDKIQLGKKYKCIASPRYSTFRRGNIYKPVDNFLCNLMNLCYECFEPIEDSEQKPTDDEMKEALQTEYEKGRADAIAEMQKEWSDKEKQMYADIIEATKKSGIFKEAYKRELVDFLNSLKERYAWKPSDKQMNALDSTLQYSQVSHNSYEHLNSLYNDLKKLKGE